MANAGTDFGVASKKLRDQLKENYVKVPPLSPKISLMEYFKLAKALYEGAMKHFQSGNLNGAYIDFHKFQILILERLPKHVDFNPSVRYVQELKKWIVATGKNAMSCLEKTVSYMDAEELRKKMFEDAKTELELMDEFDAPEPPPPPPAPPLVIEASAPPAPLLAPAVALSAAAVVTTSSSSLSSLNAYPNECPPSTSLLTVTPSAPPAAPPSIVYAEVPDIVYPYDGAQEPDPSTVDQSLSGLGGGGGITPNDLDILSTIPSYRDFYIPPPTNRTLTFTIGGTLYAFSQDDFHVSFDSFLSHMPVELQMARAATETNRCFFLHLGIATRIHPFVLQSTFRYYAAKDLNSQPDLWYGDIISTVNQYAGFVDANALSFLWPKEFDEFVICFISGPVNNPILSCFAPHGRQRGDPRLTEVFIRCDGQHFTLLKPVGMNNRGFKMLNEILNIASRAGMLVQFNEVQQQTGGEVRSVEAAMKMMKSMS